MKRDTRVAGSAAVLISILLITAAACAREEQATTTSAQEVNTTVTSDTSLVETRPVIASATAGQTALVTLTDTTIAMQATLPPGPTVFTVTNSGKLDHNFVVQRDTVDIGRLDTNVKPGENRTVSVELQNGTYRIYCPDEGHADQGMQLTLEVKR